MIRKKLKIDEMPDEMLTEISGYFFNQKEVLNFMLINKEIYEFMIDRNGRIKNHYGYCCSNLRFKICYEHNIKYLKNMNKHFIKRLHVYCKITNEDVRKYLLDVDELRLERLMFINETDGMKCFENNKINSLKIVNSVRVSNDDLKYLRNIKSLSINISWICKNVVTDIGLKYLEAIRSLRIFNSFKITDEGLKYLKMIHRLDISYNYNITDNGIKFLENVHTLNISGCPKITNKGLEYLPKQIHELYISNNNNITDDALKYLKNIHTLHIFQCSEITDKGLKYLSDNTLHELDIGHNYNITDAGLKYLENIHTLNIKNCSKITNKGLGYLKKIHKLNIGYITNITMKGLENLPKTFIKELDITGCKNISRVINDGMKFINKPSNAL